MAHDPIKDALHMMPYGFYSITSRQGDEVNAMVANWVMQASFEPRLIALALQKTSYSHNVIEAGQVFAVNIFNKTDAEAIKPFSKSRYKKPDKMENVHYIEGPETGCPILEAAAAYLECRVVGKLDVDGDHDIVVGEVVGGGVAKPGKAADTLTLLDLGWSYAG
jgi:flavin reductase (DIM6/NTAB) family NADH-FMN oxidoreductase RutF